MKAVLLIAHGSRKAEAGEEILSLTARLREKLAGKYGMVSSAFLERTTPTVSEEIRECIAKGATDILIIPYLLATGTHVARDIPEMVTKFHQSHPHIAIRILPHVGTSPGMADLICEHVGVAEGVGGKFQGENKEDQKNRKIEKLANYLNSDQ